MRNNGEPSWELWFDEPYVLLFALYLRDTFGLDSHGFPPIPPLFPVVPLQTASLPEQEKLAYQWNNWWQQLLSEYLQNPRELDKNKGYYSPEFAALESTPELRQCAQICRREAATWINARKHELILEAQLNMSPSFSFVRDVIRAFTQQSNQKKNLFRLYIAALPIQGKHAWLLAKDRAIVGRELARDPVAWREWLSPIIAALL
jgi:hypothetical protein